VTRIRTPVDLHLLSKRSMPVDLRTLRGQS
jgi:hypothetical protein